MNLQQVAHRMFYAARGHICEVFIHYTNCTIIERLGTPLAVISHVRPAYQPTITNMALCRKKIGDPWAKWYKTSILISQWTQCVPMIRTNKLMLFWDLITLHCYNHRKQIGQTRRVGKLEMCRMLQQSVDHKNGLCAPFCSHKKQRLPSWTLID